MLATISDILKEKTFWTGVGTVSVSLGGLIVQYWKNKQTLKSVIDEEQTKALENQQKLLELQKEHTEALSVIISEIKAKLDEMSDTVAVFKHDKECKLRGESLKDKILMSGFNLIESRGTSLDSTTASMIIEGCSKVGNLLGDVQAKGVNHVNIDRLRMEAITQLRILRAQYAQEPLFLNENGALIKNTVAIPLLSKLLGDIKNIHDGILQGEPADIFEDKALTFVQEFINQSLNITNDAT